VSHGEAGDGGGGGGSDADVRRRMLRWRLVLGEGTEETLGGLAGDWQRREEALGFLYGREYGPRRNVRARSSQGGLEASALTVPDWINLVHQLFPKKTIERIEKDALERYKLEEMVTNPEVLRRAQPNQTLLKAILHTKHLMNAEVLKLARDLVRKVVDELFRKLARPVVAPFLGAINRRRRSMLRIAKNFDVERTVRSNLRHFDPRTKRLVIQAPLFFSRVRRQADRWKIIVLVDESGSMADSVIHAAVTAAIFHGISSLRTHMVLFDTSVVDVTDQAGDPVETIMKVQLGGGTDIGGALAYAAGLVESPRRTIVVLITDFFEGAPERRLLEVAAALIESGVTLLGLAALDQDAEPRYDKAMAAKLVSLGAHVGAMTPGELAAWVAEKVR
jgi:Mg-chelatase subunit ChlD